MLVGQSGLGDARARVLFWGQPSRGPISTSWAWTPGFYGSMEETGSALLRPDDLPAFNLLAETIGPKDIPGLCDIYRPGLFHPPNTWA
jgi:hypothetical protein